MSLINQIIICFLQALIYPVCKGFSVAACRRSQSQLGHENKKKEKTLCHPGSINRDSKLFNFRIHQTAYREFCTEELQRDYKAN